MQRLSLSRLLLLLGVACSPTSTARDASLADMTRAATSLEITITARGVALSFPLQKGAPCLRLVPQNIRATVNGSALVVEPATSIMSVGTSSQGREGDVRALGGDLNPPTQACWTPTLSLGWNAPPAGPVEIRVSDDSGSVVIALADASAPGLRLVEAAGALHAGAAMSVELDRKTESPSAVQLFVKSSRTPFLEVTDPVASGPRVDFHLPASAQAGDASLILSRSTEVTLEVTACTVAACRAHLYLDEDLSVPIHIE